MLLPLHDWNIGAMRRPILNYGRYTANPCFVFCILTNILDIFGREAEDGAFVYVLGAGGAWQAGCVTEAV